ncbi:MAG TPA: FliH/SctL family protein [Acidobacteriaceae bacterium]|nr:FliH/SctL family protein [Acidobacteriaceae bacterium]
MIEPPANSASTRIKPEIRPFAYPEMPWSDDLHGWSHAFGRETLQAMPSPATNGTEEGSANGHLSGHGAQQPVEPQQRAEIDAQWQARLGEETRQAAEKGLREGFALGLERGREDSSGALREDRERLLQQGGALAAGFEEERGHYFHQAEEELVRLALAIAARILRREAQMDPLLLTGAVRVALGQLAQSTSVRLHVPEADRPLWEEAFARLPNLAQRPAVVGESEMELGACRIETELGSADLSLWAQLKEIERGFFDRVGARGVPGEAEMEETAPAGRSTSLPSAGASARQAPSPRTSAAQPRGDVAAPNARSQSAVGAESTTASTAAPMDESAMASAYYEREW